MAPLRSVCWLFYNWNTSLRRASSSKFPLMHWIRTKLLCFGCRISTNVKILLQASSLNLQDGVCCLWAEQESRQRPVKGSAGVQRKIKQGSPNFSLRHLTEIKLYIPSRVSWATIKRINLSKNTALLQHFLLRKVNTFIPLLLYKTKLLRNKEQKTDGSEWPSGLDSFQY